MTFSVDGTQPQAAKIAGAKLLLSKEAQAG